MAVLKDKIKEEAKNRKTDITIGTIVDFDYVNNLAKVYVNTNMTLNNVPIMTIEGYHAYLHEGDNVYIIFTDNMVSNPKIIGKAEELYAYNTRIKERHLRKGDLVVDQILQDGEIISPSCESWIDENNDKALKYGRFIDLNSIEDADKEMFSQGTFEERDIGMYNPDSSSIIKLKKDGTINIFTATNNGISINPQNKTIKLLCNNLNIDSNNWTIESNNINIRAKNKLSIETKTLEVKADEYKVGDKNV